MKNAFSGQPIPFVSVVDKAYTFLYLDIMGLGVEKKDRTGTGTISSFGHMLKIPMEGGFPILTTKKMYIKGIIEELLWFLRGETNIKTLVENNTNIWNGDAYKKYRTTLESCAHVPSSKEAFVDEIKNNPEFAKQWGELGKIYGSQWRNWGEKGNKFSGQGYVEGIDQIANIIHTLKNDPDSRRIMVNAWNVSELSNMTLPPCHYGFQCNSRELNLLERAFIFNKTNKDLTIIEKHEFFDAHNIPKRSLSLAWDQRSVDFFLGLPFNISSYGTLLLILCKILNMYPENLVGSLKDTHIYLNHLPMAEEQRWRLDWFKQPEMKLKGEFNNVEKYWVDGKFKLDEFLSKISYEDFELIGYQSHPAIKAPLSN